MRKKEKKGFYHEEKRVSFMTSIGRLLWQVSVVYYGKHRSSIKTSIGRLLWQALVVIEGSKGGIIIIKT